MVLHGLIGIVGRQTPLVVVVVVEVNNVIATIGCACHLIHALVLVAQPVVALGIQANAIETAKGFAVGIMCQHGAVAVVVNEEQ